MRNILVTGVNGQLGREMGRVSQDSSNRYLFTDIEELYITDIKAIRCILKENSVNVVVNSTAYGVIDEIEDDFRIATLINQKSVLYLALACKEVGATLIHVSTNYVSPGDKKFICREGALVHPQKVYGQTRDEGEKAIAASGCKALIFRTAWLYSRFGTNFMKVILKLILEKEKLEVVFDQSGTPTYVGDLAPLIYKIIEEGLYNGNEGIYHYLNGGACSWYDFALEIAQITRHAVCDIQPCYSSQFPSKEKRTVLSILDKTKVEQTFGVRIPYWRDSLKECINRLS